MDAKLGNVAWRERVDGWKMKAEKNAAPMSTGQAVSERGAGDIDARSDVLADDSLLLVFPSLSLSFIICPFSNFHIYQEK